MTVTPVDPKDKVTRNPKSLEQKLADLDSHLFLLRTHLHKLPESDSHLKLIAAELRTLICYSSRTEGLLWRLVDELGISDKVALQIPGKLIPDHPLVQGLEFMIVPVQREGHGDPRLPPDNHSLKELIKEGEAVVATGKIVSHEYLIKAIAQQMGTAHEDDGLEPILSQLITMTVGGVSPFVTVLKTDAELTLEVGERVMSAAEARSILVRSSHSHDYGNASIVIRLAKKKNIASEAYLFKWHSYISAVSVEIFANRDHIIFKVSRDGATVGQLKAPYLSLAQTEKDLVAAFSYCSRTRTARTTTPYGSSSPAACDLGWLHAAEFALSPFNHAAEDYFAIRFMLTYERLISTKEIYEIDSLPPDGSGLFIYEADKPDSPFPD